MEPAPIIVFAYNRPDCLRRVLDSLALNEEAGSSTLYIFSDGPAQNASEEEKNDILEVRKVIREKNWCGKVIIRESAINKGLANAVISGVSEVISEHGKAIVLEDDLLVSSGFLSYMNEGLERYKEEQSVMQISAHNFPSKGYEARASSGFFPMSTSWGWATWKRAWDHFDEKAVGYQQLKEDESMRSRFNLDGTYPYSNMLFDQMETGKVNSWAIRWWWTVFKNKGLTLFPDKSLVMNIGFGEKATHTVGNNPIDETTFDREYKIKNFPVKVEIDRTGFDRLKAALKGNSRSSDFDSPVGGLAARIRRKLNSLLNSKK